MTGGGQNGDEVPSRMAERTPNSTEMPAHTIQMIFEMNNSLGRIEANLKAAEGKFESGMKDIADNTASVSTRLGTLETNAAYIKGILWACLIIIPVSVTVVLYLTGEKIDRAISRLFSDNPPIVQQNATTPKS